MKILIADDERMLVETLRDGLIRQGLFQEADVLIATDGESAVASYVKNRPDILLVDMVMPRMHGTELIRAVRGVSRDAEILVMTGHANLDTAVQLFQFRITDFLCKPIRMNELVIILRRICEQVRLRRENDEMREKLIRAEKFSSIGVLAAGIAHEISNPNTYIHTNLELLLRLSKKINPHLEALAAANTETQLELGPVPARLEKHITTALQGSSRIRKTVSALRTLTRSGGDEKAPVDLALLVDEARTLTHHKLLQHRCELDIPEAPRKVFANEQEIFQVLMNLFVNAADAMTERHGSSGKGLLRIILEDMADFPWLTVRVEDNGTGMPPEVAAQIFEPFFTTKPADQGTGLGLSISKGNLERNGGSIECRTRPGEGTEFLIRLPVISA